MKSHKEIRLLAAVLLFIAGGIVLFGTAFYKGIPFINVLYTLVLSGAIIYLGVALLVFKTKLRVLNIVALGVLLLMTSIPVLVGIGKFLPNIATVHTPSFYLELGAKLVLLAILILVFINAIRRFNLLLVYVILAGAYVGMLTAIIIIDAADLDVVQTLAIVTDVALLAGLAVALVYYKDVDDNGAKDPLCVCTRRELREIELSKKKLELLKDAAELQKDGIITQKEFEAKKATLL